MLWIILVGFVAGILARIISPGPNNPSGFILTTLLGIAGAFLATFIGQQIGHYGPNQGAGFITATIGALVVLFIWNRLVVRGSIPDPGQR
ncbi:GlsB/YeaQ/YmgE family stress response membrane protein [Rhodopseudomonas boonkerdii]|uniref:GlsB/YeaQ/YmgE family stress response membrane protein n=1 Tax=Rhodopseudomonas boonkerdii TaxID=475937 RepID=UPI001E4B5412|nr:GlsB/YeaQ/YmgE family stress response membrane protein [Rhodopseudomonas boonkerdii]UGV25068.1 GlsB/YeaQ/YmgE family stress response membrane protein [Rhodopseudomonas boonkerdii]